MSTDKRILQGLDSQVRIPHPESVYIDDSVDPENIGPGVTLHPGCRLRGASTVIGPGCEIGAEAPATLEDCQLGHGVQLKGGYFSGSVFLDGASVGSAAHIRPGTLLEEGASAAHANGFKQTILMPFVTTGSLINFCDCLMAGGTGPKNHSEVGSSYVHFNFTPQGDKATASLIGDVPRGVMLDRDPIFLGGQGGLVGPTVIEYGTVIGAGSIQRKAVREEGRLIMPGQPSETLDIAYDQGVYRELHRRVSYNLEYLGNVFALREWYQQVRHRYMQRDPFRAACYQGALSGFEIVLGERLKRLEQLFDFVALSAQTLAEEQQVSSEVRAGHRRLLERGTPILQGIQMLEPASMACAKRDQLLGLLPSETEGDYLAAVRALSPEARAAGSAWLQAIVDACIALWPGDADDA